MPAGHAIGVPTQQAISGEVVRAIYAVRVSSPIEAERIVREKLGLGDNPEVRYAGQLQQETLDKRGIAPGEMEML